jgi:hypothetical protein
VTVPAAVALQAVWLISETVWWVGADDGSVYYTIDGGTTWTAFADFPATLTTVEDIAFHNDSVGYITGAIAGPVGVILRTYNGGFSWTRMQESTGLIPANDEVRAIAACENDPNFFAAVGLADDASDEKGSHIKMSHPVIEVAKDQKPITKEDVHTLESGVRVRLQTVSPALINEPVVPIVEKNGKEYPNPLDPGYHAALERYEQERGAAALDAVVMFGLELVDGMPEDDLWLRKLQMIGVEIDDDPITQEFYYKKYIALGGDLQQLEDVDAAKKSSTSPEME